MSQVEVAFMTVFGNEDLAMLERLMVPGSTLRYGSIFCMVTL